MCLISECEHYKVCSFIVGYSYTVLLWLLLGLSWKGNITMTTLCRPFFSAMNLLVYLLLHMHFSLLAADLETIFIPGPAPWWRYLSCFSRSWCACIVRLPQHQSDTGWKQCVCAYRQCYPAWIINPDSQQCCAFAFWSPSVWGSISMQNSGHRHLWLLWTLMSPQLVSIGEESEVSWPEQNSSHQIWDV